MDLRLVSTPLTKAQKLLVCTIADAKAQARVTDSDEDGLIGDFIETAYDFLAGPDGWLGGLCLLQEDWEGFLPSTAGHGAELPVRPLAGAVLTSFEVAQQDGSFAAVPGTSFNVIAGAGQFGYSRISRGLRATWPSVGRYDPRGYRVRFTAGITPVTAPALIPRPIVMAIKMLVAHWYNNRETVGKDVGQEIQYGLKALAGRYRLGPDHS